MKDARGGRKLKRRERREPAPVRDLQVASLSEVSVTSHSYYTDSAFELVCRIIRWNISGVPLSFRRKMASTKPVHRVLPKNFGLLELIRAKREHNWQPSARELKLGFRGWHQRGYMPHFDAPRVTQFVTFQLLDAFPVQRHAEWEAVLLEPDDSAKRRKLEAWLDRGYGECWLRLPEAAQIVEQVLLEADGQDYQMKAWVIMSNHIHFVVDIWEVPLGKLINGWKGKSARLANTFLQRHGKFWLDDYYDTLIRDETHLKKAIRYTEKNPVKAFLTKSARHWPWGSARRRDEYERLPSQIC